MFLGAAAPIVALQLLGLDRYASGVPGLLVLILGAFAGLGLLVVAFRYRAHG
jgi:hypothetical protein